MSDFFGPIISSWQVEQAAIATLQIWMPEYLAEIERKNSLPKDTIPRPPALESVHGGIDFDTWTQELGPEIIVVVHPTGEPELSPTAGYTQAYDVKVGCLCIGTGSTLAEKPEDETRAVASYLGAATMLLTQQGDLGGLAERARLTGSPTISFPNSERRNIALVTTSFEVWVAELINENEGPLQPNPKEVPEYEGPEEPYKEDPTVEKVVVEVEAEQI